MGKGLWVVRYLCSQNVSGWYLNVEEETIASNDWIGCNLKPFRDHTFMMATKDEQFCDPLHPVPHPFHLQKWTIDLSCKSKRICRQTCDQFWDPPYVDIPFPYGQHKYMVPYMFARIGIFLFQKKLPSCCLNKSQSSKHCLKTFLRSLVKVNGISDGILWNFMWQCW